MSEPKYAYRFCPCHGYDVEGIQTWLEEMANKGLHLSGWVLGILLFDIGAPKNSRYRLYPNPNNQDRYRKTPGRLRDLAAEFSWEFIVRYENFDIYRSDHPEAPELNTDPAVLAMALDGLRIDRTHRLLRLALHMLLSLLLYPSICNFFLTSVLIGPLFVCAVWIWILWIPAALLVDLWRINRLQQALLLNANVAGRRSICLQLLGRITPAFLLAVALIQLFLGISATNRDTPLSALPAPLPFTTYSDLVEAEEYQQIQTDSLALNGYSTWAQPHSSVNYAWQELGNFKQEPGSARALSVDYHETASEWFARGLMADYCRKAESGESFIPYYPGFDYPELPVDEYAVCHADGSMHILLRQGTIVVRARVSFYGNGDTLWLRWAQAMAQRLLDTETPDA